MVFVLVDCMEKIALSFPCFTSLLGGATTFRAEGSRARLSYELIQHGRSTSALTATATILATL